LTILAGVASTTGFEAATAVEATSPEIRAHPFLHDIKGENSEDFGELVDRAELRGMRNAMQS
jgi:hypothetical protein